MPDPASPPTFRRELTALHGYAALVGILVGAGIFRVTGDAYALTGPSVVLGYVVLAPVVLATAIPYAAFLGIETEGGADSGGGDFAHIVATFGLGKLAFVAAWLKLISYLGAAAYLALTLADYGIELLNVLGAEIESGGTTSLAVATLCLVAFWLVQAGGARWFGRVQTWMFVALLLAIAVLVVPGLFAIRLENYRPFFAEGSTGFLSSLPPLFFAYAGFEALAHHGGEVRERPQRLPAIFVRGLLASTLIFVAMAAVALGTLTPAAIAESSAPMATAAATYLPAGAAAVVALGGVLAAATSVNATIAVPPRLAVALARTGLLPSWLGHVHANSASPRIGLVATIAITTALLWSGQLGFALGIAVLSLMGVYLLHGCALLALPRRRPELWEAILARFAGKVSAGQLRFATFVSVLALAALIATLVIGDIARIRTADFGVRFEAGELTSIELWLAWAGIGLVFYAVAHRRR